MTREILASYMADLDNDLLLTPENRQAKNYQLSWLYSKWLRRAAQCHDDLEYWKNRRIKLYNELFDSYRWPGKDKKIQVNKIFMDKKSEIDIYVEANDEYIEANSAVAFHEMCMEFIDKASKQVMQMGHAIRISVEIDKLKLGII